jgi:hypothetical protein
VAEAEILCDRAVMVGAAIKEKPCISTIENMKIQNGKGVNGYSNLIAFKLFFRKKVSRQTWFYIQGDFLTLVKDFDSVYN